MSAGNAGRGRGKAQARGLSRLLASLLAFVLVVAALHVATDHLVPAAKADAAHHAGLCTLGHSPALLPAMPPLPLPSLWEGDGPAPSIADQPLANPDHGYGIRRRPGPDLLSR